MEAQSDFEAIAERRLVVVDRASQTVSLTPLLFDSHDNPRRNSSISASAPQLRQSLQLAGLDVLNAHSSLPVLAFQQIEGGRNLICTLLEELAFVSNSFDVVVAGDILQTVQDDRAALTTRYRLEDVNQGYRDLLDGRNIRGLLIHET